VVHENTKIRISGIIYKIILNESMSQMFPRAWRMYKSPFPYTRYGCNSAGSKAINTKTQRNYKIYKKSYN
jgi:hypothetical protein